MQYLEVDQEAPAIIPSCRPPPDWPTTGRIEIKVLDPLYPSPPKKKMYKIN